MSLSNIQLRDSPCCPIQSQVYMEGNRSWVRPLCQCLSTLHTGVGGHLLLILYKAGMERQNSHEGCQRDWGSLKPNEVIIRSHHVYFRCFSVCPKEIIKTAYYMCVCVFLLKDTIMRVDVNLFYLTQKGGPTTKALLLFIFLPPEGTTSILIVRQLMGGKHLE